jgi:hypothetical protein
MALDLLAPGLAAPVAQPEDAGLGVGRIADAIDDALG